LKEFCKIYGRNRKQKKKKESDQKKGETAAHLGRAQARSPLTSPNRFPSLFFFLLTTDRWSPPVSMFFSGITPHWKPPAGITPPLQSSSIPA
jgi:hypothetical protein